MKVSIDTNKCIGCGACVSTASEVFELQDIEGETKAQVKDGADLEKNKQVVLNARDGCPVGAISVEEESEQESA